MSSFFTGKNVKTKGMVVLFFLGAALLITFFAYGYAKELEGRRIQNEFDQLARTNVHRVFSRVEGYERALLDLRGFFIASSQVTDEAFKNYLDGINVNKRYPALYRIGYAPIVTSQNKSFIEKEIRNKAKPDFQLSKTLENHPVVLYGYPFVGDAFGMILDADLIRKEALEVSRDTGNPHITSAIKLRFDREHKHGFLIYVPLYKTGIPPTLSEERKKNVSGYLFTAFRTEDLITSTIIQDLDKYMDLELYDTKNINNDNLIFKTKSFSPSHSIASKKSIKSIQQLNISGKWWTFSFSAKPGFIKEHQSMLPLVVAISGILISFLIAWLASAISDYLQAEKRLRYLAFYDSLTMLPNRTNLYDTLDKIIPKIQSSNNSLAVLLIELTGFRPINYTLGHQIGDKLLKKVSLQLREQFKEPAFIARLGNVQFGVVLQRSSTYEIIGETEQAIQGFLNPIFVEDVGYELGMHIGIAFYPSHGEDSNTLIQRADIALNQAREKGRNYVIYDPLQEFYKPQCLALLGKFRKAMADNQFQLYYQPKVNLRTGKVTSVEGLIRWHDPSVGFVSPAKFIPIVEPTALIHPLTMHVIELAIKQSFEWNRQNIHIPIAINLSSRNLLDAHLPEKLNAALKAWGAEPGWIDLEITESSVMRDPAASLSVLNQIHSMGHRIAVDDFGTGYSGLSYIMKLPVDVIKIDQTFTMHMMEDADAAVIVKSTIEMAHNMGKKVVAEGTSNIAIWNALVDMDCDEAQGQFISHPLPISDFTTWLESSRWHSSTFSKSG